LRTAQTGKNVCYSDYIILTVQSCEIRLAVEEEHSKPKVRLGLKNTLKNRACCSAHLLLEFGDSSHIHQAHVRTT